MTHRCIHCGKEAIRRYQINERAKPVLVCPDGHEFTDPEIAPVPPP